MPKLNGLELVWRIRERKEDANAVFLSSFEKYALSVYKVKVRDFIMKERYRTEILAVLDKIWKEKRNQDDYYTILTSNMVERLRIDEIRYLTKEIRCLLWY